ncbi:hypothetical protein C5167_002367 [Papaver somniferum]|uniref:Uncharacterized protein n=1 Tax=Papaver somniferum TaxID=3469 RepID=A0A4Y7KYZ4_PAPSO|nr:hypothetical protein C5167_002367 [Papaver somniferum]
MGISIQERLVGDRIYWCYQKIHGEDRPSLGSEAQENVNLKLLGTGSGDSHTGADTELPLQPQGSESGRETNLSDIPEHYLRSAASENLKLLRVETSELHEKEAGMDMLRKL